MTRKNGPCLPIKEIAQTTESLQRNKLSGAPNALDNSDRITLTTIDIERRFTNALEFNHY